MRRWRPSTALLAIPAALAACAAGMSAASWAAADVELATPVTEVVGAPRGFSTTPRGDRARTGRAHSPLPGAPRELWRREMTGGIDLPPVIDSDGAVLVALAGADVVKVGADGRQQWRRRVGAVSAVADPVLTSDGALAVVGVDGVLRRVSPDGRVASSTPLGMQVDKGMATPLALDDGSLVLAGRRVLVRVGRMGRELGRVALPAPPVGGLLRRGDGVLVTTNDGDVLEWRAPLGAHDLGSFGGAIDEGAVLVGERTVVAIVDRQRVVALDLLTGARSTLASERDAFGIFESPVTLSADGVLLVSSSAGELLGIDGRGVIVRRAALEDLPTMFNTDGGAPLPSMFGRGGGDRPSPPLVVDEGGRIGFARSSGKVGVMNADGRVAIAQQRLCPRPLAVLPAGPDRMLAACRNGTLAMYGSQK